MSVVSPDLASAQTERSRGRLPDTRIVIGLSIFGLFALAALAPQLFTSFDPLSANPLDALKAPSGAHLFGTDNIGRDLWSRIIHGARTSMGMGVGALLISAGVGILLGSIAGLAGKRIDAALNGCFDILFAFPDLLLALLMITILGTGSFNTMLAIGIGGIPGFARVLRGEIIRLRQSAFVESSTALGISRARVIGRHILPNAIGPVAVLASLYVGKAIIYSSALSFLGLGPARPTPEWGLMLADSQLYLTIAPWFAIFPGAAIMLAAVGSVLLARGLRASMEGRDHD